ncbi:TspO/MBR family protein [Maricaulis sp.]|uniref:TspO/MBR family protein n=1 Tax=Maricaulis sp. TaxID=1486257 RepID=UPI001B11DD39|nr:TspO/MBR family protein [Maricaulis sp.]MBO6763587.1 tryptophan-rich sensory protein [Maricaulis sp.]
MDGKRSPGIVTLLVYLIAVSSLAGGLSGWIHATGAFAWLTGLNAPNWTPGYTLLNLIGLFIPAFVVIALWINQRAGAGMIHWLASGFIALFLIGLPAQIWLFFSTRDVALGFVAALAMWVFTVFAVWVAGRSSRPAGVLMWVPFAWQSFFVILGFELMRLNTGGPLTAGML